MSASLSLRISTSLGGGVVAQAMSPKSRPVGASTVTTPLLLTVGPPPSPLGRPGVFGPGPDPPGWSPVPMGDSFVPPSPSVIEISSAPENELQAPRTYRHTTAVA